MRSSIHLVLFALLAAAEFVAWPLFRQAAPSTTLPAISGAPQGIWLHFLVALLAAIGGCAVVSRASLSARATLAIFFFIIAATLPLAGVLAVGAFAWIFSRPTGDGLRPEDKYIFGNPEALAAREEKRKIPLELRPLAESMRDHGLDQLEEMIHGLKHLRPARLSLQFLRRFQTDPHSKLQFTAQGAITAHFEQLEHQLKILSAQARENPSDIEPSLSAAEVLLEMADRTPAGDATADIYREDAMERLRTAMTHHPESPRNLLLQAHCNLALGKSEAARTCARKLRAAIGESDETRLIDLQALFLEGNWSAIPEAARQLQQPSAECAESIAFWTQPKPA